MTDTTQYTGRNVLIGTAPDSWGVWFPDDTRQTPWNRFLDEASAAGYRFIELGPYGYLPTDPNQLQDELAARGLELVAGTVFTGFHKSGDQWDRAWQQALEVAGLVSSLGAKHLVVIPDMWRSETGATVEPRTLTDAQWVQLAAGHDRLGQALQEEFGVQQQFHPHADSHVGTTREVRRLLAATDPRFTSLCLDTGHYAYYGGDSLALIAEHPDRIGYLHLKQVDPDQLFDVLKNDVSFAEAVPDGIMVEPPLGIPELGPIIDAAAGLGRDLYAIVEQDMYPVDSFDTPLPIATRTQRHLAACSHHGRFA